jgi:hypothetical protein
MSKTQISGRLKKALFSSYDQTMQLAKGDVDPVLKADRIAGQFKKEYINSALNYICCTLQVNNINKFLLFQPFIIR